MQELMYKRPWQDFRKTPYLIIHKIVNRHCIHDDYFVCDG